MTDAEPVRVPVYLSCRTVRDRTGSMLEIRERRLVRQSADDRVIAVIQAPAGSRVRCRPDRHGHDQLVIPSGPSLLLRLFGRRELVPAKYAISDARGHAHGLTLISGPFEAESGSASEMSPPSPTLELVR